MKKYDWNIENVKQVIKESVNFSEALEKLNIPRQGNNTSTLKNLLDREGIDYSHFTGRARVYAKPGEKSIDYYLNNEGTIKTHALKEKLIKFGLKENKCECCGIVEWNSKPLIMLLHHIDGNNKNNNLSNLMMLCPNCHSLTENFCGSANKPKQKVKNYCPDCGKEINKDSTYCSVCIHKHIKRNTTTGNSKCPSLEQLINDIKELKTYTAVGNKYEVSDKSVAKWIQKYHLPYYIKDLKTLIETKSIEEILEYSKNETNIFVSNTKTLVKYDHDLILKLIDLKYTTSEISNYIGCSKETIKSVGSKYKHPVRRSNVKCIGCYKNGILIKYGFGGTEVAKWLIQNGYIQYSLSTLLDLVNKSIYLKTSINGFTFLEESLPNILDVLDEKINLTSFFINLC